MKILFLKKDEYEITIDFVECPSKSDSKDKEDTIISTLVDSAINLRRKKIKESNDKN